MILEQGLRRWAKGTEHACTKLQEAAADLLLPHLETLLFLLTDLHVIGFLFESCKYNLLFKKGLALWNARFAKLYIAEELSKEACDVAASLSIMVRQMLDDLQTLKKGYHAFFGWLLLGNAR